MDDGPYYNEVYSMDPFMEGSEYLDYGAHDYGGSDYDAVLPYAPLLFITGFLSSGVIGEGRSWLADTTVELGETDLYEVLLHDQFGMRAYSPKVIGREDPDCCDECLSLYPSTTLFNYQNEVTKCICLETKPGKIPTNSKQQPQPQRKQNQYSGFYSGVCGRRDCMTTPSQPDNTGAPSKGSSRCIFPFTYSGVTYYSCAPGTTTTTMEEDSFWCSTKVDWEGEHVSGQGEWGYCSQECQ